MRRVLVVVAVVVGALALCAACGWGLSRVGRDDSVGNPPPAVEVEDCDAEDYANRETDCGFAEGDERKKRSTAKPSTRTAKPTKTTKAATKTTKTTKTGRR